MQTAQLRPNLLDSFLEVGQPSPGGTVRVVAASVGLAGTCALAARKAIAGAAGARIVPSRNSMKKVAATSRASGRLTPDRVTGSAKI